jgi:hypothetical protein
MSPALATSPSGSARRALGPLLLILLPVLATFTLLFYELRGLPMFDDFQALVLFAVKFRHLYGAPRLLYIVAAQHDEYKLIFLHLLAALQLTLTSHLDLRSLATFGNLWLIALLWVYWRGSFPAEPLPRRLLLYAPICLLLVQLNYAEVLDWATVSLQMLPAIVFVLASIQHLLGTRSHSFPFACLAAFLACVASANGFLLAPVGLLVLLPRRRWHQLLLWPLPFALSGAMYLYRYLPTSRILVFPHPTFRDKLLYLLRFLGAAVENQHHVPVRDGSVVLGLFLLATFAYALYLRYDHTHPFAFFTALWVVLSALGVAQKRIVLGADLALVLRYKIYSDMMLVFAYGFFVHRLDIPAIPLTRRRLLYRAALAASFLLYLSSGWFGYRFLERRRQHYEDGFHLYRADPAHFSPLVPTTDDPQPVPPAAAVTLSPTPPMSLQQALSDTSGQPNEAEFARVILNQAIAERLYLPPARP